MKALLTAFGILLSAACGNAATMHGHGAPSPHFDVPPLAAVADNFTTSLGLEPTGYGPNGTGGIAGPSTDSVGAFRILCTHSHFNYDDPIVYPGRPGASHLHDNYGNTGTNSTSSYTKLRTTGGSTCGTDQTHPADRASYWFPAMLDGEGNVNIPRFVNLYYKTYPASSTHCAQHNTDGQPIGICTRLPTGIRFIFGYNFASHTGGPYDPNSVDQFHIFYECRTPTSEEGTFAGRWQHLTDAMAHCSLGSDIVVLADAPNCWDGTHLDSADHHSHVIYGTQPWSDFFQGCPPSHPYLIPTISIQVYFPVNSASIAGHWKLSSDAMAGTAAGGSFHFDFFEAWSPAVRTAWQDTCIDTHSSCSGGDLGNGTQIKGAGVPAAGAFYGFPNRGLVPVP